jgi:mRNA-degrading endonuclease RelE of RelBE toxin-antitoxin system
MGAYEIVLKKSAIVDLDGLPKHCATQIADAIERHLQYAPTKAGKIRIKRLRGIGNPDYRLRIGDYRAFYTVDEEARQVDVLKVMHKDETHSYYEELTR